MGRIATLRSAKACGCEDLTIRQLLDKYTEDGLISFSDTCTSCGCTFVNKIPYGLFGCRTKHTISHRCDYCKRHGKRNSIGAAPKDDCLYIKIMTPKQKRMALAYSPFRDIGRDAKKPNEVAAHRHTSFVIGWRDDLEFGRVKVTSRR